MAVPRASRLGSMVESAKRPRSQGCTRTACTVEHPVPRMTTARAQKARQRRKMDFMVLWLARAASFLGEQELDLLAQGLVRVRSVVSGVDEAHMAEPVDEITCGHGRNVHPPDQLVALI